MSNPLEIHWLDSGNGHRMFRILGAIVVLSSATTWLLAEPFIAADPACGATEKTRTVTFTAIGFGRPEEESGGEWTITWSIMDDAGHVVSNVTSAAVYEWTVPDKGGLFKVNAYLWDSEGNLRAQAELTYVIVDVIIVGAPREVRRQNADGTYSGVFSAIGIPAGGELTWRKTYGPGEITFSAPDPQTGDTVGTFHTGGRYRAEAHYSYSY
jgi:hypothetical protein